MLLFFFSEFFFESEFHDEDSKQSTVKDGNKETQKTPEGTLAANKNRSKSKNKKKETGENRPLLGGIADDLLGMMPEGHASTGGSFSSDLIGMDLNKADESDALLLELASLDFGTLSQASPGKLQEGQVPMENKASCDLQDAFLANFEDVFGSSSSEPPNAWNRILPSHMMSTGFADAELPLLLDNPTTSSAVGPNSSKEAVTSKKLGDSAPKKV